MKFARRVLAQAGRNRTNVVCDEAFRQYEKTHAYSHERETV